MGGMEHFQFGAGELLKSVLHSLAAYNAYLKVSAISRKRISLDINILQIKRIFQNQLLRGKFIFNKKLRGD
jgi:hypothetical protein